MKCRFVSPGSPNDGMLVESHGSPGYDLSSDMMRDDWATITLLEDTKYAKAGARSQCHIDKLKPIEEGDI